MTGKSTRNYPQQILEYIKEKGHALLPDIITSVVESNAEQFNKLYSLQDDVLTAINEFNASINKLNEVYDINNQNDEMNTKFDTLLNLISKNKNGFRKTITTAKCRLCHMRRAIARACLHIRLNLLRRAFYRTPKTDMNPSRRAIFRTLRLYAYQLTF